MVISSIIHSSQISSNNKFFNISGQVLNWTAKSIIAFVGTILTARVLLRKPLKPKVKAEKSSTSFSFPEVDAPTRKRLPSCLPSPGVVNFVNEISLSTTALDIVSWRPRLVIMIGPPAAGKGTIASELKQRLNCAHVSAGDALRDTIKKNPNSDLAKTVKAKQMAGELVPTTLVADIVFQAIWNCSPVIILDGFPRDSEQLEILVSWVMAELVSVEVVVNSEVSIETASQRILDRVQDPVTGEVYNLSSRPPPAEIRNRCISRAEDANLDVLRKRYAAHYEIAPTILRTLKRLTCNVLTINGLDSPSELADYIVPFMHPKDVRYR